MSRGCGNEQTLPTLRLCGRHRTRSQTGLERPAAPEGDHHRLRPAGAGGGMVSRLVNLLGSAPSNWREACAWLSLPYALGALYLILG